MTLNGATGSTNMAAGSDRNDGNKGMKLTPPLIGEATIKGNVHETTTV